MSATTANDPFVAMCARLRLEILQVAKAVLVLKTEAVALQLPVTPPRETDSDRSEMIANTILAYRHLEDARMRLGKAIQAYDGGVSVYER